MGFTILYSILGMKKFIYTLETFLSQTLNQRCSWKKKIYFTFNNKTLKNRLLLSSGEATLMYKYETCIIIASNLHHSQKEGSNSQSWTAGVSGQDRKKAHCFLEICLQACYFGYFEDAWSHQKPVGSTYRELRCLSTCRKSTWSLNSFLYYN